MFQIMKKIRGHEKQVGRLKEAIESRRLAQTWIFAGPSGVGKKQVALSLAQSLVCDNHRLWGCGECGQCQRIEKLQSENLLLIEPQGTQIKVEQAQSVLDFVHLQKIGRSRIVIIDEAQAMNPTVANSLLKTLEEPPADTYFILLVRSLSSLLQTIRSRAQVLSFSELSRDHVAALGKYDDWVLSSCGGSVERAEQLAGEGWGAHRQKTFDILERSMNGSVWNVSAELKELIKDKEVALFAAQTIEQYWRDVLQSQLGGQKFVHQDQSQLIQWASNRYRSGIDKICRSCQNLQRDILGNVDRHLSFENFLMQLREVS